MILSKSIINAVNYCVERSIPFVVYRLPGGEAVFFADPGDEYPLIGKRTFTINRWNTSADQNVVIRERANSIDILEISGHSHNDDCRLPYNTDYNQYIASVSNLIANLKQRGGKTVISRAIVGKLNSCDWGNTADRIFTRFSKAFCHIYYTPQTGAWLGATPEILLEVDNEWHFKTMALAGTQSVGSFWSGKNIREQQMVTDFIVSVLTQYSSVLTVSDPIALKYGEIEHLCSRIEGEFKSDADVHTIVATLSPTPAVAGLPREVAISEIAAIEQHDRSCYAGYIAVVDEGGINAFVNLRCMQFLPDGRYCIYAGGGITAESDPDDEWNEASSKASALLSAIES